MLFWIASTLLVAVTLGAILLPLFRTAKTGESDASFDVSIYRRQMLELEQDLESGHISQDQAKAARAEIARRLLAADDQVTKDANSEDDQALSKNGKIAIAIVTAVLIFGISFTIYLKNGVPGMPDQPFFARCDNVPEDPHTNAEVNAVIDCLAIRMESKPEADGLSLLARSYLTQNRFEEAANTYARAIELAGAQPALLEGMGLAVIFANDGVVTEVARDAFVLALENDPESVWSKFYLAEYDFQQGNKSEAVEAWIDLLARDQENERFRQMVDGRIRHGLASIAADQGLNPQQPGQGDAPGAPELSGMSDEQRQMIRGMVNGLAERLAEDPNNLEGWLKLIRSYVVLGDQAEARSALEEATLTFLTDRESLQQIVELSEELGLTKGPSLDAATLKAVEESAEEDPARD